MWWHAKRTCVGANALIFNPVTLVSTKLHGRLLLIPPTKTNSACPPNGKAAKGGLKDAFVIGEVSVVHLSEALVTESDCMWCPSRRMWQ